MSAKVTDTDRGAKALVERIRALANSKRKVRVGVLADAPKKVSEGSGGKLSLLEVAIVHEFGGGHVPQRSFIRATVDEKRADIGRLQLALVRRVAAGAITEEQALSQLGAKVAAWCQARIAAGISPPLAESTLARKKNKSTPLILTGQLRASITYAVDG